MNEASRKSAESTQQNEMAASLEAERVRAAAAVEAARLKAEQDAAIATRAAEERAKAKARDEEIARKELEEVRLSTTAANSSRIVRRTGPRVYYPSTSAVCAVRSRVTSSWSS